jgi:hypothetical protein
MFQYPEGMPMAAFKEQLRLLGEKVMPTFTKTSAAMADSWMWHAGPCHIHELTAA